MRKALLILFGLLCLVPGTLSAGPAPVIMQAAAMSAVGVNPTTIDQDPCVLSITTAEISVTCTPDRQYDIFNYGLTTAGAASTAVVFISKAASVDDDYSEGSNKFILLPGSAFTIGPPCPAIYFQGSGSVIIGISPGPKQGGSF